LSWKSIISHSTTWRHYWHPDTATRCIWQSKCILCVQRTQVTHNLQCLPNTYLRIPSCQ
jgi:hypothetical protein